MPSAPEPCSFRILLVDDAVSIHDDFRKILMPPGGGLLEHEAALFPDEKKTPPRTTFAVDSAYQGQEGLACVERACSEGRPYAVAFVDMRMPPGWDGIETVRRLWLADPMLQIVICTAHSDYSWEETVDNLGINDNWVILKKPFDNIEVLQLAHALAAKWQITRRDRARLADLDATVRERTVELEHSENRFAKAFHANPVPVTLQTLADGRYLDVNDAFLRLLAQKREDVIGHTTSELHTMEANELWQASLASLQARAPLRGHRARLHTRSGEIREVQVWIETLEIDGQACLLSNLEDITDRVLLEQQLLQSQKMEAVGQLAAGIAHDFNNLLTVIQTYTCMTLDDESVPAEHRLGLSQVRVAADRATALTRQLLVFSRRQITQPRPVDLGTSLAGLREMLTRVLPASHHLEWDCLLPVPRIQADEANLTQVIMNLVVNARDALPAGGTIRVKLRARDIDATAASRHADARVGRFVCLSVSDNGTGIEPAILGRIFEPFFTTKPVGQGTGLGLSTVYAIVRQHQGWVEVASKRNEGTTFDVFFPALDEAPRVVDSSPAELDFVGKQGRGERLLLVEDEESVRHAMRLILQRAGYHVTEAVDAISARVLWAAATEPFEALVTDMVMPHGIDGAQLAAELRQHQPTLKVILSTGYSQSLLDEGASKLQGAHLLLKPYTATSLLATLRSAFNLGEEPGLHQTSAA